MWRSVARLVPWSGLEFMKMSPISSPATNSPVAPISASRVTRSGCRTAYSAASHPPTQWPTSAKRSSFSASNTSQ